MTKKRKNKDKKKIFKIKTLRGLFLPDFVMKYSLPKYSRLNSHKGGLYH